MKILLISPLPPPAGGIATWTENYLSYMKENGHRIDLVNTAVTGGRAQNYSKVSLSEELLRLLKTVKTIFGFLFKNKYDLVHFNTSCSPNGLIRDYIFLKLIRFFRADVILQCHCNVAVAIEASGRAKMFGKMVKKAKKCLVLNRDSQEFIKDNYQTESIIVPNFLTRDYALIAAKEKENPSRIKTLLYLGHLYISKGCDNIIEAAGQFPELRFRMVGHVNNEIAELPKTDNVEIVGEVTHDEVLNELENADALLFPTHTEGFPLTVIEAMAFGLPIITTRVGAIPDILEDSGGIYISVNNTAELVAAIEKIADDKPLRDNMSAFNREKVVSSYLIDSVLQRLCEIYQEI